MPRHRHPNTAPILTLADLAASMPGWVRLWCETPGCGHHAALPLAPLLRRWGPDAPRAWLDTRFRCSRCGRANTSIRAPSNHGSHGPEPFPDSVVLGAE
ncbi:MAG: hypothetical protein U0942_15760 [Parvibaculum sp.]|uniref:hypothetical protein n=1 Tax=Parvibaculum sp. TaxID=2024848 RepID=UPI002AB953EF|nr:hypothetical protein [Parvibaculum sp.]MDZ4382787.1 hypothetical protein [Parvibaculum sp.]